MNNNIREKLSPLSDAFFDKIVESLELETVRIDY